MTFSPNPPQSVYPAHAPRVTPGLVLSGLLGLVLVALSMRGRIRGRYWTWRSHTAFGPGSPKRRFAHALAFGDWARRMRRLAH